MNNELETELRQEYFEWLYRKVYSVEYYNKQSYRELLLYLFNYKFIWYYEMDENRAKNGISLRYRFGYESDYSDDFIRQNLDIYDCSVLEMIIALAIDIEENIMLDPLYGDRTGQWFWNMMSSLGIGNQDDSNFNESHTAKKISIFMTHHYKRNGQGGLFTIHTQDVDMTQHDIWWQALQYVNELLF